MMLITPALYLAEAPHPRPKKERKISAEGRAKMKAAAIARWANYKTPRQPKRR